MRRLAVFAGGFSLGVFLAQYLLQDGWRLLGAGLALALGLVSALLPQAWRRRGVILFAALSLGLGWSWLCARQVQRPAQTLAGRTEYFTAVLCGYASKTDFGAQATVRLEGVPGKAVLYAGRGLLGPLPDRPGSAMPPASGTRTSPPSPPRACFSWPTVRESLPWGRGRGTASAGFPPGWGGP